MHYTWILPQAFIGIVCSPINVLQRTWANTTALEGHTWALAHNEYSPLITPVQTPCICHYVQYQHHCGSQTKASHWRHKRVVHAHVRILIDSPMRCLLFDSQNGTYCTWAVVCKGSIGNELLDYLIPNLLIFLLIAVPKSITVWFLSGTFFGLVQNLDIKPM